MPGPCPPRRLNMVNAALTTFVGTTSTALGYWRYMDTLFIHGRAALSDAAELMERFGDDAGYEAASRAERSRDEGNVARFCHWRQIERVIATLSSDEVRELIH